MSKDSLAVTVRRAVTRVDGRGVPLDQGECKIWVRAVLSTTLPARIALVLDPPNVVSIDTLGGLDIEWSTESGELFSRNQIQARVETRIGVSVYQPPPPTRWPPRPRDVTTAPPDLQVEIRGQGFLPAFEQSRVAVEQFADAVT